jgi:hypothetical protein
MTPRSVVVVSLIAFVVAAGIPVRQAGGQTLVNQKAALTSEAGTIVGFVRDAIDNPIPAARLRLRDVTAGRLIMTTRSDQEGRFRFGGVPPGSYLVELVDEGGKLLAVSDTLSLAPADIVNTLIRLGSRSPWHSGFFLNAAAAAVAAAAGLGVTAIGNGFQPASGRN